MKFTLSWLKDYLETNATLDEICIGLTAIGLEVEGVEDKAEQFANFKTAKVVSAEKHPDADKLKLCKVETADHGIMQIVCGAPNARAGMTAVFAPSGSYIPGLDVTLKKAKIRGVESNGMLVSEKEMLISDEHKGIIDLPEDTPIGVPLAELFGMDDPVIEIGLTPNRPDCAGIIGIARDLAAAGLGKLKEPEIPQIKESFDNPVGVVLDFPDVEDNQPCPLFLSRTIRGVKNGPSPQWLQQRLKAIGLRPISALVDITNYMSFAMCRPLHVFDTDKLQGNLRVHLSKGGETLNGLNDKSYSLEDGMTVISDDSGVIGIGGILGGAETGCTEETTNVTIECAYFDPIRTAMTGRKLQVISDARYRFERGIDPAFTVPAIDIASQMVMDLCGGEAGTVVQAGEAPDQRKSISFDPARVAKLTGVEVDAERQKEILGALGFEVEMGQNGVFEVQSPSWRPDIEGAADLVEEVIRIEGLNKVEAVTLPKLSAVSAVSVSAETRKTWLSRKSRHALAARGLLESVSWAFMDESLARIFGANDNTSDGQASPLRVVNPISEDLAHMRPSILPNLAQAAQRNADRGLANASFFEVGPVFFGLEEDKQPLTASGIRTGFAQEKAWQADQNPRKVDLYDAKADALAVLEACGFKAGAAQVVAGDAPNYYHPGRSAALRLGKVVLGYFGELHPLALKALDANGPVVGFEIYLEAIPAARKGSAHKGNLALNSLMPLSRDFAFVVDQSVEAQSLMAPAAAADKGLITNVDLFDVYQGKGVEDGHKSLAISVTLQPSDKTLTEEEIEAISGKIIANVEKQTGGKLRG